MRCVWMRWAGVSAEWKQGVRFDVATRVPRVPSRTLVSLSRNRHRLPGSGGEVLTHSYEIPEVADPRTHTQTPCFRGETSRNPRDMRTQMLAFPAGVARRRCGYL